jgi:hypothetical protein
MKEHKILLAILVLILILSTYRITNARAEDWQGWPFAGRADKQEVMPAVREGSAAKSSAAIKQRS